HTAEHRPSENRFIAVHLSGGTSEVLLCTRHETGYEIEKIGGTIDLHAGQLVDRVGVAMGLSFPAGPALEELAREATGSFRIPSAVDGVSFSFSGPEASLLRAIKQGDIAQTEIARATE
ncbi:hypothetical protein MXD62_10495, partial [Frankia sp. Mgl5]|nr:hypothetical protein [Frankia sp. Mgl5]